MSQHSKVYGFCENKCKVEVLPKSRFNAMFEYSYVVDSDQKLADWAYNVEGNDYTSVLIKKGSWSYSGGSVNLTTTGTKVVVGEAGSCLTNINLLYDEIPTSADYYMIGVNIENSYFKNCTNLTNCIANNTDKTYNSNSTRYAFRNCSNLTNCTGSAGASVEDFAWDDNEYKASAYGFYQCTNLNNCVGNGRGTSNAGTNTSAEGYGFYECDNIVNCKGTGRIVANYGKGGDGSGFKNCLRINNSYGEGIGITTSIKANAYGFCDCDYIVNCYFNVDSIWYKEGFKSCNKMLNCDE